MLSGIIDSGCVQVQSRITAYRLDPGRPFGGLPPDAHAIATQPLHHLPVTEANRDWGTAGNSPSYSAALTFSSSLRLLPAPSGVFTTGQRHHVAAGFRAGVYPAVTVMGFVKPVRGPGTRSGNREIIAALGNATSEWEVAINDANRIEFRVNGTLRATSNYVVPTTQPTAFAFSYDSDRNIVRVLINGQVEQTLTSAIPDVTSVVSSRLCVAAQCDSLGNAVAVPGTTTTQAQVEGITVWIRAVESATLQRLYAAASTGSYYRPEQDIDVAPTTRSVINRSIGDLAASLNVTHRYPLSEAVGVLTANDTGTGAVNGTYNNAAIKVVTGPVASSLSNRARALFGDANHRMESNSRLFPSYGSLTQTPGFTLAFWVAQGDNFSRNRDVLLGTVTPTDAANRHGFVVTTDRVGSSGQSVTFEKLDSTGRYSITVPDVYMPDVEDVPPTPRDYALYVFTVDSSGTMLAYVNGTPVAGPVSTPTSGIRVGNSPSRFRVGHIPGFGDTSPEHYFGEVWLLDRALTSTEINNLYKTGAFGGAYSNSIVSERTTTDTFFGLTVTSNSLPTLTNAVDITPYISQATFETAIDQVVSTGALAVADDSLSLIRTLVRPNDVIQIERRYFSHSNATFTDWQPLGLWFATGVSPITSRVEPPASGGNSTPIRQANIGLMSVAKMFQITNTLAQKLEPDRFRLREVAMVELSSSPDVIEFGVPRYDDPTTIYDLWTTSPTPVITLRRFRNWQRAFSDPPENIPPQERPAQVIIRSAQDSMQWLGGRGILRIDADYYTSPLGFGSGIGDPDPDGGVLLTADRYCTPEDQLIGATITDIRSRNGLWEVQISNPDGKLLGETLFIEPDQPTFGCEYRIRNSLINQPISRNMAWDSVSTVAGGGTITWAGASPPSGPAWAGTGAASNALSTDNLAAYTSAATGSSLSHRLRFSGLNLGSIAGEQIEGIQVKVVCSGYTPINQFNHSEGFYFAPLASDTGVNDHLVQFSQAGTLIGENRADTSRTTTVDQYRVDTPSYNEIIYGGPTDTWGLGLTVPATAVALMDLDIQVAFSRIGARALIEYVEVTVFTKRGSSTAWYQLFDASHLPVNPNYEGITLGTRVTVGNANRVEDMIRKLAWRSGFQDRDPSRPFYVRATPLPEELVALVPPLETTLDTATSYGEMLADAMQTAPANYVPISTPGGGLEFRIAVQSATPSLDIPAVSEISVEESDTNIYTQVIARGEGGDSVNLASPGLCAMRAVKATNWATDGSTPTGSGIRSELGRSYGATDSDYTTMNNRLLQLIDGNQRTPQFTSGGWMGSGLDSMGVLWARSGGKTEPWSIQDEDLFIIDLGRDEATGLEYFVDALQFTVMDTYRPSSTNQATTIPQQISVFYITELDYVGLTGDYPPATPDQSRANLADSYFPIAAVDAWKPLVDQYQCDFGQNTVESESFETVGATRARFLKIRVNQGHYFDGRGVRNDRALRIVFSDLKVFTSRRIVSVVTMGASEPFTLGSHRQLAGRIGLRPYILPSNPYLDSYDMAQQFAINQLTELTSDFGPVQVTTFAPHATVGDTVRVHDPITGSSTEGILRVIRTAPTQNQMTMVDYRLDSEVME